MLNSVRDIGYALLRSCEMLAVWPFAVWIRSLKLLGSPAGTVPLPMLAVEAVGFTPYEPYPMKYKEVAMSTASSAGSEGQFALANPPI